ncbi:MAG: hypothetical protein WC683_03035 [bacterium]
MTTPKTTCGTCGGDYPVGSTCPSCGPHNPGAALLGALRGHGSGLAPDPFEQAEACPYCDIKDQVIKAAGEQIEALEQKLADAAADRDRNASSVETLIREIGYNRVLPYGDVGAAVEYARGLHARIASDASDNARLCNALNRDKTGLAQALVDVLTEARGRRWLGPEGGWGSYEWQEHTTDTLRKEIEWALDAIETIAKKALATSGALATETLRLTAEKARAMCRTAVDIPSRYGMIEGAHHKQWVIDQMLRKMLGEAGYATWVAGMNADPDFAPWDTGIAP